MGELSKRQGDYMASRNIGAALLINSEFPGKLGCKISRNQFKDLLQYGKLVVGRLHLQAPLLVCRYSSKVSDCRPISVHRIQN